MVLLFEQADKVGEIVEAGFNGDVVDGAVCAAQQVGSDFQTVAVEIGDECFTGFLMKDTHEVVAGEACGCCSFIDRDAVAVIGFDKGNRISHNIFMAGFAWSCCLDAMGIQTLQKQ